MSSFEVKVYKLEIIPHPNAEFIELAKVGDYVSIVKKGDFQTGDLGVYIPEQAIVPQGILQEMGLEGRLSGSSKNRVKAIRLRQVVSQGLIYPSKTGWQEGQDVQEELGITKYDPVEHLPQTMRGKWVGVDQNITVNYDIENVKKYNTTIEEGELVQFTEKVHGTFSQFGYIPQRLFRDCLHLGCYTATSKGLGGRGILLDFEDESNVYIRTAKDPRYGLGYKLPCIKAEYKEIIGDNPIYICGEIFGPGIQKGFGYGLSLGEIAFRLFDIAYGERSDLRYMDAELVEKICKDYDLPITPVLYRGPFSKEILLKYTSGKESVSGRGVHIREGIVVKPLKERYDGKAGRVILKSVSDAYLLGDNTEFQ